MTDAITAKPKKRGRPSKGGRDPMVGFRATPELITRLDAVCAPTETRTDVILSAVEREIKRREKPKP
jgi:hypothetical protein